MWADDISAGFGDQKAEAAWRVLTVLLVDWLLSAPGSGYVIIDLAWPDEGHRAGVAPYVQFAVRGRHVRSEAVSNLALDPLFGLDPHRTGDLERLGWRSPTRTMRQGSTNFHCNDVLPEDAERVARRLVATLRDVYGVPEPCFLEVCGFDDDGTWSTTDLLLGLKVVPPRHVR